MAERLREGQRVRVVGSLTRRDFTAEAQMLRQPGASGWTTGRTSDSHGLCYEVEHDDKTTAWYDPDELVPVEWREP